MNKNLRKKITGIIFMITLLVSCNPKDKKIPLPNDEVPPELHGNWQSSCFKLDYVSTSQSYKMKINLGKYSAVVNREIYLDESCTVNESNYLGDLIYKYDVKRSDEEIYDTKFIGAEFKTGKVVTLLNSSPRFCDLETDWVVNSVTNIWGRTCVISGAWKAMKILEEPFEIIPIDNKLSVTFDNYDFIFTKF